jgi:peptidoglycan/LPS O-acetylase OafA/YrhL
MTTPSSGAAPPARSDRFYRPELDGLRFFAFFAVYLNHTATFGTAGHHRNLPDWLGNALGGVGAAGAFGVDLFFALSAYLITELLLRERDARGTLDVRAFYARRVLRIWPLYFAFLLLARALAYVVPGEAFTWGDFLGFALFSGNWTYMLHPVATVAAPLWSVSVEEQFYILWPFAVRRASRPQMAALAAGIVGVGIALRVALAVHGVSDPWVSKNSLTRADGIAAGVLLALALHGRPRRIGPWARSLLLAAGLGCLLAVGQRFELVDGPPNVGRMAVGWPLVAAACGAILLAVLGDRGIVGRLLASRVLVYLGRISYGLYVYHQVGLLVAGRAFPGHASSAKAWAAHFVLGLAMTIALAAASYAWLEKPFLRLKERRFTIVRSRPDAAL